jgi:serine/threonine protein kinase
MNQIGKYRVLGELGRGGFGAVYLCEDNLGQKVAVKIFDPKDDVVAGMATSATSDAGQVLKQRFQTEAITLRQLSSNPYIVNLYDFDETAEGVAYYVMPYLQHSLVNEIGKDAFSVGALEELEPEHRPRRIPVNQVIEILTQILEAMKTVHREGLVHRDLKPANILFDKPGPEGKVQVCDFGIAKLPDTEHSQSGVGMGSRNYMSPEQRESAKHVDATSDVYSIGVISYRMLTGTLPGGRFEDPIVYAPGIGPALNELILSAISYDVTERPKDASQFLAKLKSATGAVSQDTEDNESTGTWVDRGESTIRNELKPLQAQIEKLLLENGEIPAGEKLTLEAMADIAGLSDTELTDLIEGVEFSLGESFKPFKNFVKAIDRRMEQSGSLSQVERQSLLTAGEAMGLDSERANSILNTRAGKPAAEQAETKPRVDQSETNHAQSSSSIPAGSVIIEENSPALMGDKLAEDIGLMTLGDVCSPLLETGESLPLDGVGEVFSTAEDNQSVVTINLVRQRAGLDGSPVTTPLGKFNAVGIEPAAKGIPQIRISLYSHEGTLWLAAFNDSTGTPYRVEVEKPDDHETTTSDGQSSFSNIFDDVLGDIFGANQGLPAHAVVLEKHSPALEGTNLKQEIAIKTVGDETSPLVAAGERLPLQGAGQVFSTAEDNQTEVTLQLVRKRPDGGTKFSLTELGKFSVSGIEKAKQGVPQISIQLHSKDDTLWLSAEDQTTRSPFRICLDGTNEPLPTAEDLGATVGNNSKLNEASDLKFDLSIPLATVVLGGVEDIQFPRLTICKTCKGLGQVTKKTGFFNASKACANCNGDKVTRSETNIKVNVPPGVDDGDRIKLAGMGDETPDQTYDLYVSITVEPHTNIERDGADLRIECDVPETMARNGGEVIVNNLQSDLKLKIPANIESGKVMRLAGCGITSDIREKQQGDLYVTINVVPDESAPPKKSMFGKIFGKN